jgi:hypothetical protein
LLELSQELNNKLGEMKKRLDEIANSLEEDEKKRYEDLARDFKEENMKKNNLTLGLEELKILRMPLKR